MKNFLLLVSHWFYLEISSVQRQGPLICNFPQAFDGMMFLREAVLREYLGKHSFGKMIGIVMGSGSIGGIIGPTLAGQVFDSLGSDFFIWLAFSGLLGLGITLILRIKAIKTHRPGRSR